MSEMGLKKTAVLCILRHGDELLLMRRTKALHHGHYVPVGGKVEPFESPRAAAVREAYEEAGVALEEVRFCGVMAETAPVDYNWVNFIYLADIPYYEPPPCVEGVLEWVPVAQLESLPLLPTDLSIYRYALAGRPFVFDVSYDEALHMLLMAEELSGTVLYPAEG
jgi:8-oxo-dGTP diphosphatase